MPCQRTYDQLRKSIQLTLNQFMDKLKIQKMSYITYSISITISDHQEPVLMIALGKEKVKSRRPRGYRKPVAEL